MPPVGGNGVYSRLSPLRATLSPFNASSPGEARGVPAARGTPSPERVVPASALVLAPQVGQVRANSTGIKHRRDFRSEP